MRLATHSGTTSSSTLTFGSGEITVRPEKSTRLPLKFPRKRPSLPFNRLHTERIGRPFGKLRPETSELMNTEHFSCKKFHASSSAFGWPPRFIWFSSMLLASTISLMLSVRSSSLVPLSPMLTVGRMQIGGTGTRVMTKCSGCTIPNNSRSWAGIILSKLYATRGFKSSFALSEYCSISLLFALASAKDSVKTRPISSGVVLEGATLCLQMRGTPTPFFTCAL